MVCRPCFKITNVRFITGSAANLPWILVMAHAKSVHTYLACLRLDYLQSWPSLWWRPVLFNKTESIISEVDTNKTLKAFQNLGQHYFIQSRLSKKSEYVILYILHTIYFNTILLITIFISCFFIIFQSLSLIS